MAQVNPAFLTANYQPELPAELYPILLMQANEIQAARQKPHNVGTISTLNRFLIPRLFLEIGVPQTENK